MLSSYVKMLLKILVILNIQNSISCPIHELSDAKAAYKSGEILEQSAPITLDKIKVKLRERGIFDEATEFLDDREKKELRKLYEAVEIMISSRNRQPQNVQNMFSSLRLVERVVKKQLKENQISETLAAKFHWEKLAGRQRRQQPSYYIDKNTNMRVFNANPGKTNILS